jgi:hypothetical protein
MDEETVYEEIGKRIGKLVSEKQKAYGDSFSQSSKIIEILYPNGIPVEQYIDALAVIRVIDKLFRIANDKGYGGESPWNDMCGYSILSVWRDSQKKDEKSKNKLS